MRVEIVPYDPRWVDQFAQIRSELATALAGVDVEAIEHVGSTAVPGLAAKPIIDIDIVVRAAQLRPATRALVNNGYKHQGEKGIPDRRVLTAPDDGIARHVIVALNNSLVLKNHLAVRDLLRKDVHRRDRYAEFKLMLAEKEWAESHDYAIAKTPMIDEILEIGGLTEDERAAIRQMNDPR